MGLFIQNVIAVIWDFDKTLIPGYMQAPLFKEYDVDEGEFWAETNALPAIYQEQGAKLVDRDTLYLNRILKYVSEGKFRGLTNKKLRDLGANLKFYNGLPGFFGQVKSSIEDSTDYLKHEIKLEHYIVSTGLRQMIVGSAINSHGKFVWGCEFSEGSPKPGFHREKQLKLVQESEITDVVYSINNTTKTRAMFEINKGTNVDPNLDVNASIPPEDRRVPFQHMIYIADGPSDIPVFSVLKSKGGRTFAVFAPGSKDQFAQVDNLQKQGRIDAYGPADYSDGTQTHLWITKAVREIADQIVCAGSA